MKDQDVPINLTADTGSIRNSHLVLTHSVAEQHLLGERLRCLAQGMVDLLDSTLSSRADDVRRWAAEPVLLDCLSHPATPAAARRLERIVADRTVYLDLWIVNADGIIVATGCSGRQPGIVGSDVSTHSWFREAIACRAGAYTVSDIADTTRFGDITTLPFAAPIYAPGTTTEPRGVIALFFDWQTQSETLLHRVRQRCGGTTARCLLLDRTHRVIAASDRHDPAETVPLPHSPAATGWYLDSDGIMIGYARSTSHPGFPGLNWCGVIAQRPHGDNRIH
ncbi:cache domain-containing protein [Magnetospirillum molischianum]|uniref:Uncharacterized protein n=1 Tax=Magnetospirillum molischianum DSM 120 TaxID=1150626 RepID=H8FQL0_MAGML|nr:cache domain-containing protein [Magnetospirillum molischianum]CCG40648.1 hypothetical protein PHAMO_210159 [Magnetospirillum molischianum DSM 120]